MIKKYLRILFGGLFLIQTAIQGYSQQALSSLPLIPKPKQISEQTGQFELNSSTMILADETLFEAQFLKASIKELTNLDLKFTQNPVKNASIILLSLAVPDTTVFDREAYQLLITNGRISITAADAHGLFYGIQTLLQMLPIQKSEAYKLTSLNIIDAPKYSWRGMHLDVCRHFFPISFIKRYIDYLSMYKMNTFHWHLTDDQGWRIEIKKYPELTKKGAWRKGSMVGHYNQQTYDTIEYGGFYTQDEIKEVVAYAAQRHVTVVPEIEMPGHALAALTAYPQYSCTGGPFELAKGWGVFDDVFCPKEETFTFLQDILSEVIELFPSQYIHIGGDECPKVRWQKCSHCQSVIKREGLKGEHELQSYFITRIEKFVNSKGRKIIGWDEILEGGLAPNAAVMSWRGTEGGIEAAKQKHFVVMTPGSHCYFDHYQGEPKYEPISIGGNTSVEKVYGYQPTPAALSKEEAKYILGAQGNLWTEYISSQEHVEYMALPRMAALAEVVWGTSDAKMYLDFRGRLLKHFELLDKKGVNYSKSIYQLSSKITPNTDGPGIVLSLNTAFDPRNIKYSLNDEPLTPNSPAYNSVLLLTQNTKIKAAYFEQGKQKSSMIEQMVYVSKSTGKKINLKQQPGAKYAGDGAFSLVNGLFGDSVRRSGDWIGFRPHSVDAVIDLGKETKIKELKINALKDQGSWIHYPKQVEVWVSKDGVKYQRIAIKSTKSIHEAAGKLHFNLGEQLCRYVKVIAVNAGKIPEGNPGAGSDAWLFVDEIWIE